MRKQLALCIPTYQNAQCVEDFFDNCLAYYLSYSLDIYFFDSSTDDATQQVVQAQMQLHPGRIFYVRWDASVHSNAKVFRILQGQDYPMQQYQYVWFCSDAIQYTAGAMQKLLAILPHGYDVICLNPRDYEHRGCLEYTDCERFFSDFAWVMTLYGTAVLRRDTILANVDWISMEQLCLQDMSIINFSHTYFIFRRIRQLDQSRLYNLSLAGNEYRSSVRKKASLWRKSIMFRMSCIAWVKGIEGMPYSSKAIREVLPKLGRYVVFASPDKFVVMRLDGLYDIGIFVRYWFYWPKVCDIPRQTLLRIALTPVCFYRYRHAQKRKRLLSKLQDFCHTSEKVVIYGVGRTGIIYSDFLDSMGIRYAGYCVTRKAMGAFRGHPVWEFAELATQTAVGYLLAMARENATEVMAMLQQHGVENYFYSTEVYELVCHEMGYRG